VLDDSVLTWFRRHRTALIVVSAVVLVAAFAALVWGGAPWLDAARLKRLTPVQQESAIDAIRGRLHQLGAGLVVSIGLVYTALNFRLSRRLMTCVSSSSPSTGKSETRQPLAAVAHLTATRAAGASRPAGWRDG
jgi:hypothetical protein